jgi:branched-chain amino acid transport system permease protein
LGSIALDYDGIYYFALAFLVVAMVVSANIERSKTGWAMATVKQSAAVASALGIRVDRFKVAVFSLAAVFAAVAGVLLSLASGVISPGTYSLDQSIILLAMLTLGGMRGNLGPILGSAFFVLLPEYLQGVQDNSAIVFALTFIAILMLAPGGVVGLVRGWVRRRRATAADDLAHSAVGVK